MDSGEVQGHLLCTLPFPESKEILDRIRKNHPKLKITYRHLTKLAWNHDQVPEEDYRDATIIATLAALPSSHKLIPNVGMLRIYSCVHGNAPAGTNHLHQSPIYQSDVTFCNSSGIHGPTIAEWVVLTMLVHSRHYNLLHKWQKDHYWGKQEADQRLLHGVTDNVGKRLAVLGYGSIGRQVAKVARAMGMDVIAYTASPRKTKESKRDNGYWVPGTGDPEGEIPSTWYSGTDKQSLHHFLGQDIDYLLISVPLTNKTKHMLGKEEFEVLSKKNAFVTNVARGEIIVQEDIIEALKAYESSNGKKGLRGAALDVTSPEPLPADSPLWEAPNCIVTPHMSGIGQDYSSRCFEILELNIKRHEEGRELLNIVDKEKGYSSNAARL